MFIIYMNDISTVLRHCKYQLYADDTVIYSCGDLIESTANLCQDLSAFKYWCDKNKLTLNIGKTKYVTFGLKSHTKKIINHNVFIDNLRLDRVCTYKYQGVTLDMRKEKFKRMSL